MGLKEYLFGYSAEDLACKFLRESGYEILHRNFHSRFGEIDIIARRHGTYHFIEVKATSKQYDIEYKITPSKMSKIIKTIDYFVTREQIDIIYQIDAIIIKNRTEVNFIENITQ